jgi:hypothetical protein
MEAALGAETLMLFRGVERLAVVAAGVLLIYFGYRLFLTLPTVHGSDGELKMPSASVTVSKVGPGVFFAVFGTFLLWQMAEKVIRFDLPAPTAMADAAPRPQAVFGTPVPADTQSLRLLRQDMAALNCLEARMLAAAPAELRMDMQRAVQRARAALIEGVWQPRWGGAEAAEATRLGAWPHAEIAEIATARHREC